MNGGPTPLRGKPRERGCSTWRKWTNTERSVHRKIAWTAEDRARHKAIREKFQNERPTPEQLLASGDYIGPLPHRVILDFLQALAELKSARTAAGLSLADVADRSGIDKAALSRLENGVQANPTVETLARYAAALGKRLRWSLEDATV